MTDLPTQPPADHPIGSTEPPHSPESSTPVPRRSAGRRIGLSLLLALLCAVLAGVATWFLAPDRYQSTGVIDIKPFMKRVLFPNEQNTVMPLFDTYVSKQISIMQQQRCIQFAMESETWRSAAQRKSVKRTLVNFTHSLSAGKQGELIVVSFVDNDPELAQAGVKAIINSYRQIAAEREIDDMRAKQILENRIAEYTRMVNATQNRINEMTKDFGTEDLSLFYNAWATILNDLDKEIVERQETLALSQGPVILETQPATSPSSETAPAAAAPATPPIAAAATTQHAEQIATARAQLLALSDIRARAHTRMIGIGQIMRDVATLKSDIALSASTLEAAKRQSEQNNLESLMGSRMVVFSDGDVPLEPLLKPRIRLASIIAGATFILVALVAFFLLRPRRATAA